MMKKILIYQDCNFDICDIIKSKNDIVAISIF